VRSRLIEPATPAPAPQSAWRHPGPPRVEASRRHVIVVFAGEVIADSRHALRVLEPDRLPAFYFPPGDCRRAYLIATLDETFCEWKGIASHFDVVAGGRVAHRAAWSYADPAARYALLAGRVGVDAARVDGCWVDGERVEIDEAAPCQASRSRWYAR
jgi:uncharacterized protein (DUF427 family)